MYTFKSWGYDDWRPKYSGFNISAVIFDAILNNGEGFTGSFTMLFLIVFGRFPEKNQIERIFSPFKTQ